MFRKFFESGYSVIPTKLHSKRPSIDGWTRYCLEKPSEEEIDKWQDLFDTGQCGIGLCLGPASGLVALDIDTDNPETYQLSQRSIVSKRGAKGETRFFRWSKEIENNSQLLKTKGVEILSHGRQTVLPPSIHPVTKTPYKWTTETTLLDIDISDLDPLDLELISQLPNIGAEKYSVSTETGGRNNTLVQIVSAMRARGEPELDIINEIYNYDVTHHSPRLFTDASEGFAAENEDDAKKNAWVFTNRVTATLIKKNIASLPFKLHIELDFNEHRPKSFEYKAPPILSGFVSSFCSLVVASSKSRVDCISLGGALTLLSAICSNRFRVSSTWPNLYALNIAPSGAGKTAPQELVKRILTGTGLIGSSNYRSGPSMYSYLPYMQERVDLIDEASMLFRAIRSGSTWQAEMQEILCTLFSCSNSYFAGSTIKGPSGAKVRSMNDGACYNPCINILASTTPAGFRESFDKTMSVKGLLPRFLIFNQHDPGTWKPYVGFKEFESDISDLRSFCDELLRIEKRVLIDTTGADLEKGEQNIGKKYDPYDFPLSPSAKDLLLNFDRHYFDLARKDDSELEAPFFNRFYELAVKLSLLLAVSDSKTEIDVSAAQTAIDIVEMQYHNSHLLRSDLVSHGANRHETEIERAITILRKKGRVYVTKFREHFKGLNDREFNDLIKTLTSLGEATDKVTKSNARCLLYVGDKKMGQEVLQ